MSTTKTLHPEEVRRLLKLFSLRLNKTQKELEKIEEKRQKIKKCIMVLRKKCPHKNTYRRLVCEEGKYKERIRCIDCEDQY